MESCAQNPTYKRTRYSDDKNARYSYNRIRNVKRPRELPTPSYEFRYEIPEVSEITKVTKISESDESDVPDISDISDVADEAPEEAPFHEVPVIEKMDELFLLKLFITIAICLYLLGPFDYKNFTPKSHWLEL
jgi:hypothetical protein